MTEALAEDLRDLARLQGEGREGMAKVMQADSRQAGTLGQLVEGSRDVWWVEPAAHWRGEDPFRVAPYAKQRGAA